MTTRPRVTVLIDTYNYGQFIKEAIESVLAQEFEREAFEIVVVDDGSTDDTAERVKKFGALVRYVLKPNGGQASAFNVGFAHARERCPLPSPAETAVAALPTQRSKHAPPASSK